MGEQRSPFMRSGRRSILHLEIRVPRAKLWSWLHLREKFMLGELRCGKTVSLARSKHEQSRGLLRAEPAGEDRKKHQVMGRGTGPAATAYVAFLVQTTDPIAVMGAQVRKGQAVTIWGRSLERGRKRRPREWP